MADPQRQNGQPSQDAELTTPSQLAAEAEVTEVAVSPVSPQPREETTDTLVDDDVSPATRRLVVMPPQDKRSVTLPSGADIARWTGRTDHSAPSRLTGSCEPEETAEPEDDAAGRGRLRSPAPPPKARAARASEDAAVRDGQQGSPVTTTSERVWVMPLFGGIAALILLVVFAFGVMLIIRATSDDEPTVRSSSRPLASSPLAGHSMASPEVAPSQNDPVNTSQVVLVPSVVGLSESAAKQAMDWSGLRVSVQWRPSATAPPGTVLATDPPAGTSVAAGSVVVVYLAQNSPSPSTSMDPVSPSSVPVSTSPSA